ncbi:replication initiation protein [Salinibacter ruber]|uniref:replication initiation protein n=1 Tax=Salinibacter ruber TaxID=146919 RepID=UPI00216799A9|nr:replication initiation protein [Salinibacter ruber]
MKKDLRVPPTESTSPLGTSPLDESLSPRRDTSQGEPLEGEPFEGEPFEGKSFQKEPIRQGSGERFVSCMDWSILMHRIFLALLGEREAWVGEPFAACHISVRRVREMAEISQKSIYEEAAEATTRLTSEPIEFWSRDRENYVGYPIFSMCKYESREGAIKAKFNEEARPHLLRLRGRFAERRLRQAIPLPTPYAIRTYEIAKMIERPGERRSRQIPVGRFREMFGLESKYDRHSDMRRRVIDPSVEQVNEKTDVNVRCEDVRDGQTPVALQWTVESKGPD